MLCNKHLLSMHEAELNFIVQFFWSMAGLKVCNHPSFRIIVYTSSLTIQHSNCLQQSPIYKLTRQALSSYCMTSLFPSSNLIFFFNLNVLIECIRIKNSSINSVLLLLLISKCVYILAMLFLNTKCLFLILGTLLRIIYVEILTHLVVTQASSLTISFVFYF